MKGVRVSHLKKDLMVFDESEYSLLSFNVTVSKFAGIIGFAAFGIGMLLMVIEGVTGAFLLLLSVPLVFFGLVLLLVGIILHQRNNPRFEQQDGLKQTVEGLLSLLSYKGANESIGQPLHFGNVFNGQLLAFSQGKGWVVQEYGPGSSIETAPDFACYVERFRVTNPASVLDVFPYSKDMITKIDSMTKLIGAEVNFRNSFQGSASHSRDQSDVDMVLN